jgi:GNAT superfamily N-acetyltransferase
MVPVTLEPLSPKRLPKWLRRSTEEYASDLVSMGQSPAEAHRQATRIMENSFPGGRPASGHFVFDVHDGPGRPVGSLWIGRAAGKDDGAWWVWDISINESERGQGLGRETMLAAEQFARSHHARTLGLSVFGFNTVARQLYESLDYETTEIKMVKALG